MPHAIANESLRRPCFASNLSAPSRLAQVRLRPWRQDGLGQRPHRAGSDGRSDVNHILFASYTRPVSVDLSSPSSPLSPLCESPASPSAPSASATSPDRCPEQRPHRLTRPTRPGHRKRRCFTSRTCNRLSSACRTSLGDGVVRSQRSAMAVSKVIARQARRAVSSDQHARLGPNASPPALRAARTLCCLSADACATGTLSLRSRALIP